MDLQAYFRRIRLAKARLPTRAFLDDLVQHHTMSIPFENLSVVVEGPPGLDLDAIETKHTATRPNSLFANNLIVTMPTLDGRYALFNRTLTFRTQAVEKQVQGIANADSLRTVLKDVFSIALSNRELERVWEVSGNQRPAHPGFS